MVIIKYLLYIIFIVFAITHLYLITEKRLENIEIRRQMNGK